MIIRYYNNDIFINVLLLLYWNVLKKHASFFCWRGACGGGQETVTRVTQFCLLFVSDVR
jgi:hypothetical protein